MVPHLREICRDYFKGTDGKPFLLADFHAELLTMMFEGGKYVVNWPTDHGKSIVVSFLFPILSLIQDPDEKHLICGSNINDSKSRISAIAAELESNAALQRDFPWICRPAKKDGRRWSATMLDVAGRTIIDRNPSVLAVSTSANDIKGRRGKLIMDDIEGADSSTSPTKRERLLDFVRLEAWRCFEDRSDTSRPLLMAVGTPFHPDSIYFELERHGFQTRRFSAYVREYDDDGQWAPQYTWPRKAAKVEEARRDMDKEQFALQYRMDPKGGDDTRLSVQEIVEMMRAGTFQGDQVRTYVSLDPAGGSRHRLADYAGISVVRITWKQGEELPMVEIPDCYRFRQGLFEQVKLCAKLAAEHGCAVIYEANSQQGYTYPDTFRHLESAGEIPRGTTERLIRHYTTEGAKFDEKTGLSVFRTLLKAGRLRVPQSLLESDGVVALTKEIRDLNLSGAHDHILASIWFAYKKTFDEVKQWAAPVVTNGMSRAYFTPYTRFANLRQARTARR